MKKVNVYVMNEGTEYETYCLKYADGEVIIKAFDTMNQLTRYAKRWGYELVK